ncbi:hypothetical protein ACERII_03630 [Evansella sp. AB-rgal1]|uniref:hypothetical protein n=1 Tax=Evansella sp. AB-rgal1 TaxID=3242696 RepID=UPI00359E8DF9
MNGFILAAILFNVIAFTTSKRLTKNQIVHIWMFTIVAQMLFDGYIDHKYQAYWYFDIEISWYDFLPVTILVPPVNMIFLNWFPFGSTLLRKFVYFLGWWVAIVIYEVIALLPAPWGYFHYGWWNLWYSIIMDPFLLLLILGYYKWIRKIEKETLYT